MKLLAHPLILALLGAILFVGTIALMTLRLLDELAHGPEIEVGPVIETTEGGHYKYWTFQTHSVEQMLEELRDRRQAVSERERELRAWEARLQAEARELGQTRATIIQMQESLDAQLEKLEVVESANLQREVELYAQMEPEDVVTIFGRMSNAEVVRMLSLMPPESLAPLLSEMLRSGPGDGKARAERVARILEALRIVQPGEETG